VPTIHYSHHTLPPVSQGDIYRNVAILEGASQEDASRTHFPYAIVLTQECDLQQDWNAFRELDSVEPEEESRRSLEDKLLRHIIFAPCYVAAKFREGTHVKGRIMNTWNSKQWQSQICENKHIRYYYLPRKEGLLEQDLVVDFKHYFTVERATFYTHAKREYEYVCSVAILYRDALARRFAEYLSRIGFPEVDQLVKGTKSA